MSKYTVQLVSDHRYAAVIEAETMTVYPSGALLFTGRAGYPPLGNTLHIGPAAYVWARAYREGDDRAEPKP